MTSVTIPSSVTEIGYDAFYGLSSLKELRYNAKNANLYQRSLLEPTPSLTSLIIGDSVETIPASFVSGCSGLTSIEIPTSVTSIGVSAFSGCSGLTSVTIPNSVTSIGRYLFYGCSSLPNINIPNSVTSIGEEAFRDCSGLTSVTIGKSVTSIGNSAFYGCSSLTSVNIPNSVTSIGGSAFEGCSGIKEPTYNNKFFVKLPINFSGEYKIPEGIQEICDYACYDCTGLTSIDIPNSVTSIGGCAFCNCTLLQEIYVYWETPISINSSLFRGVNKNRCVLYVPKGCVNKYLAAPGWTDFNNIKEYNPSGEDNFITISGVNGTILKQVIELGQKYSFILNNDKEGNVTLVKFNGEDVTSQVTNGKYTTPLISANSEIYVEYNNSLLGDANLDGSVDVSDITSIANYILHGDQEGPGGSDSSDKDNHEYVNLGLPSGTLWATCNVGASKPEEYGDYFAWGETEPYYTSQDPLTWKDGKSGGYCWASYKYCNGSSSTMTKYCIHSSFGTVDNKTILEAEDDAATANWGSNWRMPTIDDLIELFNLYYTTTKWTTMNGVNGRKITSKTNGNSIFLPAAGYRDGMDPYTGSECEYWSSSLGSYYGFNAQLFLFGSGDNFGSSYTSRHEGLSVRPVRNK